MKENKICEAYGTYGQERNAYKLFGGQCLKESAHLDDLNIDVRIKLDCILNR